MLSLARSQYFTVSSVSDDTPPQNDLMTGLLQNTAARTQRLVEAVKPTFGRVLGIKTAPRTFSTTASSSASSSARSSRSDVQGEVLTDSEPSESQNLVDLGSYQEKKHMFPSLGGLIS
jgi:hypothetical protein